jgi:hypothetical protein
MSKMEKMESFGESIGMQRALNAMKTPELDAAVQDLIALCMTTGAKAYKRFVGDDTAGELMGHEMALGLIRLGMTMEALKHALDEGCCRLTHYDSDMADEIIEEYAPPFPTTRIAK